MAFRSINQCQRMQMQTLLAMQACLKKRKRVRALLVTQRKCTLHSQSCRKAVTVNQRGSPGQSQDALQQARRKCSFVNTEQYWHHWFFIGWNQYSYAMLLCLLEYKVFSWTSFKRVLIKCEANTWEMLLTPRAKRKVVGERSIHALSKTKIFNMFMCFNGNV